MKLTEDQTRVIARAKADPSFAAKVATLLDPPDVKGITCPGDVLAALWGQVRLEEESLFVLALNRRNQVLAIREMTVGNDAHTIVDPKQVLRWALCLGRQSCAIVLAHNHPSGDATPSMGDVEVTQRMAQACRILGIELLDHVVLTSQGTYRSLREDGLFSGSQGPTFLGYCSSR